jgi:GntR family transcriptional regulator
LNSHIIDFDSQIPYYYQLLEILRSQIKAGYYSPGDKLPSEKELCEQFGISRTVVRQALGELESNNVIFRKKGKGTYVEKPKISGGLVQKLTGFYQDMVEKGFVPGTKVLQQHVIPADQQIARYLAVPVGEETIEIRRLRSINHEPILLVTTYLPLSIAPGLVDYDLTDQSLYAFLEAKYGIVITRGTRYIEAVLASEEEASLLEIHAGDPLLMLDSVSSDESGQPIEYYHAVHRGDRSRFEVNLFRLPSET